MCINQIDKKEKQREIPQMHKIYRDKYCAVALVPELSVYPEKDSGDHVLGYNTDTTSLIKAG